MVEHEEYLMMINARLDGALSPEEEHRLNAHLAVCPGCRKAGEELYAIHEALCSLERIAPPDTLSGRILSAIEEEDNVVSFPIRRRNVWKKWLAAAAVAMVAVGSGMIYRGWQSGEKDTSGGAPGCVMVVDEAPAAEPEPASLEEKEERADVSSNSIPRGDKKTMATAEEAGGTGGARDGDSGVQAECAQEDVRDEAACVSGGIQKDISPEEAMRLVTEQLGDEMTASLDDLSGGETLSYTIFSERTKATYKVTYEGISEDGVRYLFSVTASGEEPVFWAVNRDGAEVYPLPLD